MTNKIIYKLIKSKLVKDNIILFIGTMVVNILGFLFHFFMGRTLGPVNYGVLGAIQSLVYLLNIALNTIQTSITKFVSNFKTKKEYNKIHYLLKRSIKKLFLISLIGAIIFIFIIPYIASFLHIPKSPLYILTPFIIFVVLLPVNRGVLQGLQKFKNLSLNLTIEGLVKFSGGVILIFLGFQVNGAVGAIVLSYVIAFFVGFYPLKKILKAKKKKFATNSIYKYTFPVLIMLLSLTALYSVDVILVKHFFSGLNAGYYAATALIGKILFFGSMSIGQVMFPKVAELYKNKKPYEHLLYKSILITSLFIIPCIIAYFLIPKLIVLILYGKQYLTITNLIGYYAILMGFFSLIYLVSFYNISINNTKFLYLLILTNITQIFLIYLFHNTLLQVIQVLTILMFISFVILVIITKNERSFNYNSSI